MVNQHLFEKGLWCLIALTLKIKAKYLSCNNFIQEFVNKNASMLNRLLRQNWKSKLQLSIDKVKALALTNLRVCSNSTNIDDSAEKANLCMYCLVVWW